jgi:hypothetical protein
MLIGYGRRWSRGRLKEAFAMAASPARVAPIPAENHAQRRPLALTPHRLAANRRNAARSTGPRTAVGKARVARNAIKHGYFAAQDRWTEDERREFEEMLAGLREDFRPRDAMENACVATIAEAYVRMAAMLRYENLAALKYHRQCERQIDALIAAADADEAARLVAQREQLRRAGLWGPTIPGPREAQAICRYQGRLDRAIRDATASLEGLGGMRGGALWNTKVQKRRETSSSNDLSCCGAESRAATLRESTEIAKTNPLPAAASIGPGALRRTSNRTSVKHESEKTNPLSSMLTGNRHQRRRAEAMRRRSPNPAAYHRRPNPLAPFP